MTGDHFGRRQLEVARTFLFVPGTRPDRFDKAVASGADVVILDLEDAVSSKDKDSARHHVADWLAKGGQAAVRVNALDTPWFELDLAVATMATAVVLPKTESPREVELTAELGLGATPLIPLLETPRGVFDAARICARPEVVRVGFGNVDFASHIGVDPGSHSALSHARSQIVYASGDAGCAAPIDGVTTVIGDTDILLADAVHARELGFGAKLLIHPSHVTPVSDVLRPTEEELEWARAVLAQASTGVGVVEGQMVDEPVLRRARRLADKVT
jgi:citrate lyase subunit beta/citryl-CoA lyase